MAQTEHGIGVSYKLPDGTMVWSRRDTWAEVSEDVKLLFGEESLERLEAELRKAWGGNKPQAVVTPAVVTAEPLLTASEVQESLAVPPQETQSAFETCPVCGGLKDRLVPAGVSKKNGKPYPAFYGCSTPRCPGR